MPPKAESKAAKVAPESSGGAAGAGAEAPPSSVRSDAASGGDGVEEDWRARVAILQAQVEALTAVVAGLGKADSSREAAVDELAVMMDEFKAELAAKDDAIAELRKLIAEMHELIGSEEPSSARGSAAKKDFFAGVGADVSSVEDKVSVRRT